MRKFFIAIFVISGIVLAGYFYFSSENSFTAQAVAEEYDVPVLSLRYFPLQGNNLDLAITGMTDSLDFIRSKVDTVRDQTMTSLEQGSTYHGYKDAGATKSLNYRIFEERESLSALPLGAEVPWKPGQNVYRPDYMQILSDLNICNYVDDQGVKEIWIWGYHTDSSVPGAEAPYTEPVESNMAMGTDSQSFWNYATYGDVSNSEQTNDMPTCRNSYTLYNYNYGRDLPETLENHGHHLESVFRFIDYDLFWNKFVSPFGELAQVNACGWVHSPPNTKIEYDWGNTQVMQSDCEDWYPDGGGTVKSVNCETWGGGPGCPNANSGFKIWWMQNMPGKNNGLTYLGETMRNWWGFIGDFDRALFIGKKFTIPPPSGGNVSGWAWSENIGWISFNCANTSSCATVNYGVDIDDDTGLFSGYGWSENIGWISFAPAGPYPASPNYSACLDFPGGGEICDGIGSNKAGGWARALAYGSGWDGWIKLRGSNYGVDFTQQSGEFSGYAWSDAVIGWISFKGSNYGVVGPASQPPSVNTSGEIWDNCSYLGKSIPTLNWIYSGGMQSSYQVQIDNTSAGFPSPEVDTGEVPLNSQSYAVLSYDLSWDTNYWWRVKVKNQSGAWSGWSNVDNFDTPEHAYPWTDFIWSPIEPTQGETTQFDPDQSQTFGGTAISSYLWTITQGSGTFVESTSASSRYPQIQFSAFNNTMSMRITDTEGYFCSNTKDVTAQLPLPEYKEIPPTF